MTLTHDPKLDDPALDLALRSEAFYIAALGSKRTHAGRLERLAALGHDAATLGRIHGPAGLAIGAVSPAEIALSVMAEMTSRAAPGAGVMRFGDLPLAEAAGAILAHSIRAGELVYRKGRRLSADDLAALEAAGVRSVIAARLEPGDVHEDEAARLVAEAAAGAHLRVDKPFTGRVNLFAEQAGLVRLDRGADRPAQPGRRGDHDRDPAGLRAGRAQADGRDRSRSSRSRRAGPLVEQAHRDRGRGRAAGRDRAVPPARRRADPDPAAERQGERARQDRRDHRGPGHARAAAG